MSSKSRIIIEVRGGVVQSVYSNAPVEVGVLDHDDWQALEDSSTRHEEWLAYCGLQNEISGADWLQVLYCANSETASPIAGCHEIATRVTTAVRPGVCHVGSGDRTATSRGSNAMTQSTMIEPERCQVFLLEDKIIWHSEPVRIGKHEWIVVVINHERYGRCTEYCFRGPRAPSYLPETTFVPADQFWPTYSGDHCDGGMPRSLQRLYDSNKTTICKLLVEGGKA